MRDIKTSPKSKLRATEEYKIKIDAAKDSSEKSFTLLKDKYPVTKAIIEGDFVFF